jgi:hypothetical protein
MALLDRAWGKAPQKYEIDASPWDSMSPQMRMALDEALGALIGKRGYEAPSLGRGLFVAHDRETAVRQDGAYSWTFQGARKSTTPSL